MTTDAQHAKASLTTVRIRENRMYLAVFLLAFPPLFLAAIVSRMTVSRRGQAADPGERRRSIVHEAASDARSALSIALGVVAQT